MGKKVNAELKVLLEQLLSKLSKIEDRISKLEKDSHKQVTLEEVKERTNLFPKGTVFVKPTSLCSKTLDRPIFIC